MAKLNEDFNLNYNDGISRIALEGKTTEAYLKQIVYSLYYIEHKVMIVGVYLVLAIVSMICWVGSVVTFPRLRSAGLIICSVIFIGWAIIGLRCFEKEFEKYNSNTRMRLWGSKYESDYIKSRDVRLVKSK